MARISKRDLLQEALVVLWHCPALLPKERCATEFLGRKRGAVGRFWRRRHRLLENWPQTKPAQPH